MFLCRHFLFVLWVPFCGVGLCVADGGFSWVHGLMGASAGCWCIEGGLVEGI